MQKGAIMTNGVVSESFDISRGIRQGDAMLALLYIIQAEPLAEAIRQNNSIKGIDITNGAVNVNFHHLKQLDKLL